MSVAQAFCLSQTESTNGQTVSAGSWSSGSDVELPIQKVSSFVEGQQYCRQSSAHSCSSDDNTATSTTPTATPQSQQFRSAEPMSPLAAQSTSSSSSVASSSFRSALSSCSLTRRTQSNVSQPRTKGRAGRSEMFVVATPWYPDGVIRESVTLGGEVGALGRLMQLSQREQSVRHSMRSMLQENATVYWPEATVKVYGGFAYDCSLPDSALDLVCEDCHNLESFEHWVYDIAMRTNLHVDQVFCCAVGSERQGFAKFRDLTQGVTANVTFFENRSPARAVVAQIRRKLDSCPAVRDVFTAARLVLKQGGLCDAATGGLSSYAILMMVLHAAQHSQNSADAGQLLVDFFSLFAGPFDYIISPHSSEMKPKEGGGPATYDVWVNDIVGGPSSNVAVECTRGADINALCKSCSCTLSKWSFDGASGQARNGFRGRSPLSSILAYESLWDRAEN